MAVLNKFVRASVADNRIWKQDLPSFLMRYRATPHSSTNTSPFEALTGRVMNIGLPDIPSADPVSVHVTKNDALSKSKMKSYADERRHTKTSTLSPGDHVLVKQRKLTKLTPLYDPSPYTIVEKNGSMVTAERNGHHITRNSGHFRPINAQPISDDPDPNPDLNSDADPIAEGATIMETETLSPYIPSPGCASDLPRRNPPRKTKLPVRYSDYIMN